jgi:hypothetical protein
LRPETAEVREDLTNAYRQPTAVGHEWQFSSVERDFGALMKNHILNRRSFLALTAAGLAALGRGSFARAASAMGARDPDHEVQTAR